MADKKQVIIYRRRFWWRHPDGKLERIIATPRIKASLASADYQLSLERKKDEE